MHHHVILVSVLSSNAFSESFLQAPMSHRHFLLFYTFRNPKICLTQMPQDFLSCGLFSQLLVL